MITLDATTKTLELDLNAAITTNQLPFVASYVDISQSTFAMTGMGEQDGVSNSTTAVTILSAPAATTSRVLKFLSIKNSDTVATLLWIQLNNNGTLREIWKGTLQVNDTLFLVDAANYVVIDTNGNIKTTVGTVPSSIILGTTTNDDAAAGRLGEFSKVLVPSASAVSLTTTVTANVTSLALTAGDWDVTGVISYLGGTGTIYTYYLAGLSDTSLTFGSDADSLIQETINATTIPTGGVQSYVIPTLRFSKSASFTVYLPTLTVFSVSTLKAYGSIRARRAR